MSRQLPQIDLQQRTQWAIALTLLLIHALLSWVLRQASISTGHDDAQYMILGLALQDFAYNDLHLVDTPAHHMYPPGYPALLALSGAFFRDNVAGAAAFGITLSTLSLGILYSVVKRILSAEVALVWLAALVFNPYLIGRAGAVASESLYMFLSSFAVAILFMPTQTRMTRLGAGALAIAAALTRSIGMTLLAAVFLQWLLQRRFVAAALFAVSVAVSVGGWMFYTIIAPNKATGRSYVADAIFTEEDTFSLMFILRRILDNLEHYALELSYRLSMPTFSTLVIDNIVWAGIALIGVGCGLAIFLTRWRIAALYLLVYGLLLSAWTWSVGRFLDPVLPLLLAAFFLGITHLLRMALRTRAELVVGAIGLVIAATSFADVIERIGNRVSCDKRYLYAASCGVGFGGNDREGFFAAAEHVEENHLPGTTYLSSKPATLYLVSGRQSVRLPIVAELGADRFLEFLKGEGVDFILLSDLHWLERGHTSELVAANCEALYLDGKFGRNTYLFGYGKLADGTTAESACAAIRDYQLTVRRNP